MNDDVGSISLLQHYELLMCGLINHLSATAAISLSVSERKKLWQQLRILSHDLIAVTSAPKVGLSPYIRCNVAIPTLRRLQHHLLNILISEDDPRPAPLDSETLARCALSTLISSTDGLDPSVIAPMLTDRHVFSLKNTCVVPPDSRIGTEISQLFTFQSIDWSLLSIDDSSWNDHIVGTQTRSAEIVWTDMAALLAKQQSNQVTEKLTVPPEDKAQIKHYVIRTLGMGTLSSVVRTMFFARNEEQFDPDEKRTASTYVMLGRTVTKTQSIAMEKPYRTTPSRAYMALMFCLYLSVEQGEECMQLLSNLLPVYLELIDSPDNVFCCLGVSALLALLNVTGKSKYWLEYEGHCIVALNSAFTTHRNGFWPETKANNPSMAATVATVSAWDAIELGRLGLSALLPLLVSETADKKIFASLFVALINLMAGAYPMMAHHRGKIMIHLLAATAKLKMADDSDGCCVLALGRHTAGLVHVIVSSGGNKDAEILLDTIERESDRYQIALIEVGKEIREYAAEISNRLMKEGSTFEATLLFLQQNSEFC
ncbi:unnamed protein product [Cylindrotheca closterium]|uniref:Uncharacterized protein n=1 Tax=Cylindrotheca closterium TaxID=2856 RepID=A0AAD2FII5_9STRA|nr:unnamed protein product [Cylindrotheca closterium]